jgi:hypothetical protein
VICACRLHRIAPPSGGPKVGCLRKEDVLHVLHDAHGVRVHMHIIRVREREGERE